MTSFLSYYSITLSFIILLSKIIISSYRMIIMRETSSIDLENVEATCFSCSQGEHDECYGCDCGDTGHYGTEEAVD